MKPPPLDPGFISAVGHFHVAWSAIDIAVDYAIGKFLKLPADETHLLTASMDFARRVSFLRSLIARSSDPKQGIMIKALNTIQNESKRNVFAHSFIQWEDDTISFVERTTHGKFKATKHDFTITSFRKHVADFTKAARTFHEAVTTSPEDFQAFCNAAFSVTNNPRTSPTPPIDKAE